jgi:hypothetical protein
MMASFQSIEKLKERTARNGLVTSVGLKSAGLEPAPPDYEPSELPNTQPLRSKNSKTRIFTKRT